MTMKPSSYMNPETRPFGTFYKDMTSEQVGLQRQTYRLLRSYKFDNDKANELGEVIGNIIYQGGIYQNKKEGSVTWRKGFYTALYGEPDGTVQHYGDLGVWYDPEKRLFNVLEWNKVKGVVTRSYAPMTFLKKLYKTFAFNGYGRPEITPDSFQTVIDVLFPDLSKMEVQVWDRPSEMYEFTNIDSCMVGEDYVKFYDTAPCKGLVVMLGDKLVTRCILWTLDDGRRIIGRIYDSTGSGSKLLKKWCKDNNVMINGWDDEQFTVTCPVNEHGVPYQDNFHYGVRQDDVLVFFNKHNDACAYAMRENTYQKRVFDLCHTGGNVAALRERLVLCHDGSRMVIGDTIFQDGVFYNYDSISTVHPHTLHRFPNDQMVYHPTIADTVIAAGLLDVVNGQVVVRSECITLDDGRLAHPSQVYYRLKIVNHKLVADMTPFLNPGPDVYVVGRQMYTGILRRLAYHLGITLLEAGRLVYDKSEWEIIETKLYRL